MSLNYEAIRERLLELKVSKNMSNFDFCKIYAPEKTEPTMKNPQKDPKSKADNYISALFSGRDYPDAKHGPLYPDLVHLQNIVDSNVFPDVTLNYLLFGDETPVKIEKRIDFDLSHWTYADFCELIWTLKTQYPERIIIEDVFESPLDDVSTDDWEYVPKGEIPQKRTITIKIEELDSLSCIPGREFPLGQAMVAFHHKIEDSENNRDEEIRKLALSKAVNKIRSYGQGNPFLVDLSNCEQENPFVISYGE